MRHLVVSITLFAVVFAAPNKVKRDIGLKLREAGYHYDAQTQQVPSPSRSAPQFLQLSETVSHISSILNSDVKRLQTSETTSEPVQENVFISDRSELPVVSSSDYAVPSTNYGVPIADQSQSQRQEISYMDVRRIPKQYVRNVVVFEPPVPAVLVYESHHSVALENGESSRSEDRYPY